ncbi:DUF2087 domain-containing protein [bacterium]|nr:DUF2087 domain-containing protein [bacterium]
MSFPLQFPLHPDPDYLRKQAKDFLKRCHENDHAILALLRHHEHKYHDNEPETNFQKEVTLQEMQHCLAREYGFENWTEMLEFVKTDNAVREKCLRELRHFLDAEGKFKAWPAKHKKQLFMVEFMSVKFLPHRHYTEREVNEVLLAFHSFDDPALLRRFLVDYGYLERDRAGRRYWKRESEKLSGETDSE